MAAARAVDKHHAAVARGDDASDPWVVHRPVARGSLYAELARFEAPIHERELKDALLAWIAWLTAMRVSAEAEADLFEQLHAPSLEVTLERTERMSWRTAWLRMITASSAAPARAHFSAIVGAGPRIAPRARRVREIRQEAIARLFGASTLLGADDDESTVKAARVFFDQTSDLSRDIRARARKKRPDAWPLSLDVLSAPGAVEGWPAKLGMRWLDELFGAHVQGLDMAPALPALASPASFVRALGSFGGAFRVGCCNPSALSRPPRFADAHRFAGLFASLGANEVFQRRALGLAPGLARDQAREIAASLSLSLRASCANVLVSAGVLEPEQAGPDAALPKALAGAWPLARDDESARARGWLASLALALELRDRHDEDWWRNPRAWADLRWSAVSPISNDVRAAAHAAKLVQEAAS